MRDLLNKKEDPTFGAQSAINDGAGGNTGLDLSGNLE
jgi:hypothetical protein